MKALTLHQPWASLIAIGAKAIETRGWPTSYRGPLAIHAGKATAALDYLAWMEDHMGEPEDALVPLADQLTVNHSPTGLVRCHGLPLGAIVATCTLIDVLPIRSEEDYTEDRSPFVAVDPAADCVRTWTYGEVEQGSSSTIGCWVGAEGRCEVPFGDFTPGRFAWLLTDIAALPEPVETRGRQGLWEWTP